LLDFLSNQIPVNNKIPKTSKQTNKNNKRGKKKIIKTKTKTKNTQKTLQLINNVMDIAHQNNMSDQR
jgi:hypothetical protein